MAVTILKAQYVLPDKLRALLRENFNQGTYSIDFGIDYVEVTAPRELTEAEIGKVTWRQ